MKNTNWLIGIIVLSAAVTFTLACCNIGGSDSGYSGPKTAPDAPSNVSATAVSSTSIRVNWNPVSAAAGYYVYRDGSRIKELTSTSYTDIGLNPETTYSYSVSAFNNAGEGSKSLSASARTYEPRPDPPTSVTAIAVSSSSIIVSWSKVQGATGYNVYRSSSFDGNDFYLVGDVPSSPFTDWGLSPKTTYYYIVTAYNKSGESSDSKTVWATTLP